MTLWYAILVQKYTERGYAHGNDIGSCSILRSSKFDMASMTLVLRCTLAIHQIWRLYVVFMCNWRVVVLPVGSLHQERNYLKSFTKIALQVILGIGCVGS